MRRYPITQLLGFIMCLRRKIFVFTSFLSLLPNLCKILAHSLYGCSVPMNLFSPRKVEQCILGWRSITKSTFFGERRDRIFKSLQPNIGGEAADTASMISYVNHTLSGLATCLTTREKESGRTRQSASRNFYGVATIKVLYDLEESLFQ